MNQSESKRLTAELLGTLVLVAVVVGSGIMGDRLSEDDAVVLLGNAVATGAALAVLILIFEAVSGAHFNPAVSLAFLIRKELSVVLAIKYIAAQIVGGILGTFLAHAMFEMPMLQISTNARSGPAQWLSEGVATLALLGTIFGCIKYRPQAVPYAVGLVITAGYWWTSSTSFANPAVAIARGFSDTFAGIRPADIPWFVVAQCVAAVIAVKLFGWLFSEDETKQSPTSLS